MATATLLTPDDVIERSAQDGKRYELSEGTLIEVSRAGLLHEMVKSQIAAILYRHVTTFPVGRIFTESLFPLARHTARFPDVSYISNQKFVGIEVNNRAIPFVPDLAIEVISESEIAVETETKLREYLTGGVKEVWQVYPSLRRVVVSNKSSRQTFEDNDQLLSAVLPELAVRVSELITF